MSVTTKILLIIGSILFFGLFAFTLYELHAINVRQTAIETQIVQQKELADNITRSMAVWATKADLEQFAKESKTNLEVIKKDLEKLNASVVAINVSTSVSKGQVANNLPSTSTSTNPNPIKPPTVICEGKEIPCPNADPYGYQLNAQNLVLDEQFGTLKVPFGKVGFSAWQSQPWNIDIAPRQYNSVTVLGTDENQRIYAYNKFIIKTEGKDYEVLVTNSQIRQEYPNAKFTFFNPRLYLGFDAGMNIKSVDGMVGPSINLQISSYGKYKTQPDLSILQVGAGYDAVSKNANFTLTPVSYNVGQHIPLMNNLYIGPSIGVNATGNINVSIGLRAGL